MTKDPESLYRWLNGLDLADARSQAQHMLQQMFEGLYIGDGNRQQVLDYLVMHLEAAEERSERQLKHDDWCEGRDAAAMWHDMRASLSSITDTSDKERYYAAEIRALKSPYEGKE